MSQMQERDVTKRYLLLDLPLLCHGAGWIHVLGRGTSDWLQRFT